MKSQRSKHILLVVLFSVLVYVWWGNLSLLTSQDSTSSRDMRMNEKSRHDEDNASLAFREPRTNPFKRYSSTPARQIQPPAPARPTEAVSPPPSSTFRLTGMIQDRAQSQAVLLGPADSSMVLERGDSLMSWKLVHIVDTMVIFAKEKRRDTLVLRQVQ